MSFNPERDKLIYVGFSRSNKFPKEGEIVAIKRKDVIDAILEIDDNRDDIDKRYQPIMSRFVVNDTQQPIKKLLIEGQLETKYNVQSDIAIRVESLIEGPKKSILVKCRLSMIKWPDDVPITEQYIYVDSNDVDVIQCVPITHDHIISDVKPDNVNTFGFRDRILTKKMKSPHYRVFRRLPQNESVTLTSLEKLVDNHTLHEYAEVVAFDKSDKLLARQKQLQSKQTKTTQNNSGNNVDTNRQQPQNIIDAAEMQRQTEQAVNNIIEEMNKFPNSGNMSLDQYESSIRQHPLYNVMMRSYKGIRLIINRHFTEEPMSKEDMIDNVYFDLFDAMLRVSPNFNPIQIHEFDQKLANGPDDI